MNRARCSATLASTLLLCVVMVVANANDETDCKAPSNTYDINACLDIEYKNADAVLNDTYRKLQPVLTALEDEYGHDKSVRPGYYEGRLVGDLQVSQQAWIGYRDKNCAFYNETVNGTGAAAVELNCMIQMTKQRTIELTGLLDLGY